jgi:hypothetical protein
VLKVEEMDTPSKNSTRVYPTGILRLDTAMAIRTVPESVWPGSVGVRALVMPR